MTLDTNDSAYQMEMGKCIISPSFSFLLKTADALKKAHLITASYRTISSENLSKIRAKNESFGQKVVFAKSAYLMYRWNDN